MFLDPDGAESDHIAAMVPRNIDDKILDLDRAVETRQRLGSEGRCVVFTNGCYDLLHSGHVDYLDFARRQGDALVVGINSDASVRRIKGPSRPINAQDQRARVLAALEAVDYVVIFDQDEPVELISRILPDILVKGSDWAHYVSGRDIVEKNGGRVVLAPLTPGYSTSNTLARIKEEPG